jgi:hypothetical protein
MRSTADASPRPETVQRVDIHIAATPAKSSARPTRRTQRTGRLPSVPPPAGRLNAGAKHFEFARNDQSLGSNTWQ